MTNEETPVTAPTTPLIYVDVETTGLDLNLHHAFEVAILRDDDDTPTTVWLPHTIRHADPDALTINRYRTRVPEVYQRQAVAAIQRPGFGGDPLATRNVADMLRGATLVGANIGFDIRFLWKVLGDMPWHHRPIDVENVAMTVFNWPRPRSLSDTAAACRAEGYDIPDNDHTAAADTLTARAVHRALTAIRNERMVFLARPTSPVSLP